MFSSAVARIANVFTEEGRKEVFTGQKSAMYIPDIDRVCPMRWARYRRHKSSFKSIRSEGSKYLDSLAFHVSLPNGFAKNNSRRGNEIPII